MTGNIDSIIKLAWHDTNSFKKWRKRVSGRKLKHEKKLKLSNKISILEE